MSSDIKGPLDGTRILDFTHYMQGPFGTQLLADLGADVVKVERPGTGDYLRHHWMASVDLNKESPAFLSCNRNKRSLVLDLQTPEGAEAASRIATQVDVVVENLRPGAMERLGLGYEKLRERNSGLIYCSASGYGSDGPYADRPGQDLLVQAMAGAINLGGNAACGPAAVPFSVADTLGSRLLAIGILAALVYRAKAGVGQKVEVNLLAAMIEAQTQEITVCLNSGASDEPAYKKLANPLMFPPYGVYPTLDGSIVISICDLRTLGRIIEAPTLDSIVDIHDSWVKRCEVYDVIAERVAQKATDDWLEALTSAGIWCGVVNDYAKMAADPQVLHGGYIAEIDHPIAGRYRTPGIPIKLSATPGSIRRPPPLLGEHSHEVLAEYDFDDAEIGSVLRARHAATRERTKGGER